MAWLTTMLVVGMVGGIFGGRAISMGKKPQAQHVAAPKIITRTREQWNLPPVGQNTSTTHKSYKK